MGNGAARKRREETPSIPLEDQVVFWSRVFGEESVPDTRAVHPQGMVLWGLVQPITVEEIFSTLRKTKDGAVGLDKISRKEISKLNPRALQAHFNLWLYAGYQPVEFRRSRTVLIPKVPQPSGPGQLVQADHHWFLHLSRVSSGCLGSSSSSPGSEPL